MMRLLATLALLLAVRTVAAQTASDDRRAVARPRTFDNEIGLRFGAQIGLGRDDGPELQTLSLDYARYGWRNIGLRTGVNLFLNGDVENYLSVPLHFSWRSGRIASAWRRGETVAVAPDPYGGYYDSDPAGPYGVRSVDRGSFWGNLLLSILPTAFELHTGFTPGVMCGPLSRRGSAAADPAWQPWLVRQRFSCTFDAGVRLIIPVWRFGLYVDFTYHCYLTDNFRRAEQRPSRSWMGVSGGVAFNF